MRREVAPRVIVEGKEVGAFIVSAIVDVVSLLLNLFSGIGSRVANRDSTRIPVGDSLLHVADSSLDEWSRVIVAVVVLLINNLITGEE